VVVSRDVNPDLMAVWNPLPVSNFESRYSDPDLGSIFFFRKLVQFLVHNLPGFGSGYQHNLDMHCQLSALVGGSGIIHIILAQGPDP
jgi:hypothetical protein